MGTERVNRQTIWGQDKVSWQRMRHSLTTKVLNLGILAEQTFKFKARKEKMFCRQDHLLVVALNRPKMTFTSTLEEIKEKLNKIQREEKRKRTVE